MGGRRRLGLLGSTVIVLGAIAGAAQGQSGADAVAVRGESTAAGRPDGNGEGMIIPSWRLSVGVARYGLSDGLASPLPHRGTGLLVGVGYGVPDHDGGWGVALAYWGPRIGSSIETDGGGFETTHQVDLGFAWLKRVAALADGRVALHLGGVVDGRFSFRSQHYRAWGWETKVERFGDLFVPVQVAGMWSLPLGARGLVTHRLAVPVVTLSLRSPYTGLKYFPDAVLAGPFSVTGFDSRLAYRRTGGGGWGFGLFHHLTLVRHPDPRPLSSVVHRVGVEILR